MVDFALLTTAPTELVQNVVVGRTKLRERDQDRVVRIRYIYLTKDEQVDDFMAWATKQRVLGYDTETSGISVYDHQVATIQFGNPICDDPRAYLIDVRCLSEAALKRVLSLLDNEDIVKLGQNIKFEILYAKHRLGAKTRNVICTQVTEMILRAGLFPGGKESGDGDDSNRKAYQMCSMANLVRRHCGGIEIDKDHDLRVSFYTTPPGKHTGRQIVYGCSDTIYPFFIYEQQRILIKQRKLASICKLEWELIPVIAEAELHGIGIDREAWTRLWQEAVTRQDAAERALDKIFLAYQGDLFSDGFSVGARECSACNGTRRLWLDAARTQEVRCAHCNATGVIKSQHVRPLYTAGRGKNKKPEEINWTSPVQIKWAISQYCRAINWPIEVVTSLARLYELKKQHAAHWLERIGKSLEDFVPDTLDKKLWAGKRPLPDWLLSEDEYCILTDAEAKTLELRMIRSQLPRELVEAILAFAEEKALVATFGISFLNKNLKADGRIHTEFHQCITTTGRMSSEPNLQNIPRIMAYRMCFRPRKGYVFIILDYSSIEPKISAKVSGDPIYVAEFMKPKPDIYSAVGTNLFGYPVDKRTNGGEDRQAAKEVVLGLAYVMGVWKLRDKLTLQLKRPVTYEETDKLRRAFFVECEGIAAFQAKCARDVNPNRDDARKIWDDMVQAEVTYVTSPCGRHRFFAPNSPGNRDNEAANHPIQACSATITKAAAVMVQRHIDANGIDAVGCNFVHDELVWEVREDQALAFAPVAKQLMEEAGQYYLGEIPCTAEFPEGSPDGLMPYWAKELKHAA